MVTREQLRAAARQVAEEVGLRFVVLFGSTARRARGTEREAIRSFVAEHKARTTS